ncbi:DEKNAAC101681 [Brettanomyces naardenensis]|uniref:Altered inheritance of mitochondria protein 23, mitochondrial n=1 Tax=Brettanomyces naardenensis TaxID=13370 RepID=A0A448YIN1_BRENA|nr:DEKNAAC101681 [Brettanomyces naardenensis]
MDVGRVWLSSKAAYRPHKGKKHSSHFKKKEDLFRNGTTRDKEAAKVIITKVRGMNRQGLMKLIKDGQDKGVVSVFDCCKRLDLDKEGMVIVSRLKQQIGGQHEETVPVVRVVDQQQARKAYSDYLSEQVTKRLRISNPGLIRKQERGKNSGEENGIAGESGDYKVVRVSWQITTNDLKGQKRHEIETQMKKGENVRIVFDDKNNFERTHGRRIGNGEGLSDIETTKRDKVVKFIGELIDELGTSYEEEGSMQDKLIFKVKALQTNTVSKEERKVLKDQRKMERQERLRMNTERKRARQMEDLKILSVD